MKHVAILPCDILTNSTATVWRLSGFCLGEVVPER